MTDIRRRTILAIGGAVVATAAIAVTATTIAGADQEPEPVRPVEAAATPPDGWRWESYGTVQLLVPATWAHQGSPQIWCLSTVGAAPFVGRPGPIPAIDCGAEVAPVGRRVPYVDLGAATAPAVKRFDHDWIRETRLFGGTAVTVFSDDADLRARIFASSEIYTGTDVFGCAPDHPSTTDPATRPADRGGLGSVGDVRSVTMCGYDLLTDRGPRLFTSRSATGETAGRFVDALRNAPPGTGPDAPDGCTPGELGDRVYVLHVRGAEHDQDVIVRYSGCERNGTDDGTTRRRLTQDVFTTLYTGSDRSGGTSVPEIGRWMG